jgi:hypothetical protein
LWNIPRSTGRKESSFDSSLSFPLSELRGCLGDCLLGGKRYINFFVIPCPNYLNNYWFLQTWDKGISELFFKNAFVF